MAAFVPYLGDIQLCGTNAPAPAGGAPASPNLRSARVGPLVLAEEEAASPAVAAAVPEDVVLDAIAALERSLQSQVGLLGRLLSHSSPSTLAAAAAPLESISRAVGERLAAFNHGDFSERWVDAAPASSVSGGAPAWSPGALSPAGDGEYAAGAAAAGVLLETPGPDGRARPKATPRKSIAFLKRTMSRLRRSVKEVPDTTAVALGIKRDRVRDLVQEAMLRSTNGKCSWAFGIWSRAYLRERYEERRAEKGWVAIALEGGGLPWSQVDPDAAPSKGTRAVYMISSNSAFSIAWTLLNAVFLLYILLMIPLEASFLPKQTRGAALWGIDRFLDAAFIYDITVNFRTGYYESMTDDAPEVLDLRRCANRYLRSWFLLDFVSSMPPVIEAVMSVATKGSSNSVNALRALKVLKIGRVFRVFKVVRVSSVLRGDSKQMQRDFSVSVCDGFDARLSAALRELAESDRVVQKSAESTWI